MHILYKVTYLPHLNTVWPKFYIGSKYNYKGNYFGSVDSKQIYEYTCGLPLREWWKKQDLTNFHFEVLESFDSITPQELVAKEHDLHLQLDVLSDLYFNHSIATKGYCSVKNSEQTKQKKSKKTKQFWNSPEGLLKKQRLIEKNKTTHKKIMLEKWKNPSESMLNRSITGRPKGAKDLLKRKQKKSLKISVNGIIFNTAKDASVHFGIDVVNVRRRCRMEKYTEWNYLNEDSFNN